MRAFGSLDALGRSTHSSAPSASRLLFAYVRMCRSRPLVVVDRRGLSGAHRAPPGSRYFTALRLIALHRQAPQSPLDAAACNLTQPVCSTVEGSRKLLTR